MLLMCVVVIPMLFGLRLSVEQWDEDLARAIGQLLRDVFHDHRLVEKQAASLMNMNEADLSKILRGEPGRHLSVYRIALLPVDVVLDYWSRFLFLVGKRNVQGVVADLRRTA